jgi:hypothetical protein
VGDLLAKTEEAIDALIAEAGGVDRLITPRGWPHLGVAIIDAVFSLQTNYDTVVKPLLKGYCDAAPGLSWATVSDEPRREHDAQRLIDFLERVPLEQRTSILNRQIGPGTATQGRQGVPKAQIVVDVAHVLVQRGVVTRADFAAAAVAAPQLQWAVRRVPGVGFACWKYMLNLNGVEVSKPDTMVLRWLRAVTGTAPDSTNGAALIEGAARRLQDKGSAVTVRQVDHLVWRKASGRPLGRAG